MKKRMVALVLDADKNEIYFGENIGKCKEYCRNKNITGANGEYIGIGIYDEETRSFELEDYTEI